MRPPTRHAPPADPYAHASRAHRDDTPRCGLCDRPSTSPVCARCAPLVGPPRLTLASESVGYCSRCPQPPLARPAGHPGACT